MKHHPSWTALRSYAITAGLACLMGVSYELFVFPNAFAPAGINGLATMLQYLLHVNIGYLSLLINLPLVMSLVNELIYNLYIYVFRFLIRNRLDFLYYAREIIIPELIFTVVTTLLIYRFFLSANRRLDEMDNRREREY